MDPGTYKCKGSSMSQFREAFDFRPWSPSTKRATGKSTIQLTLLSRSRLRSNTRQLPRGANPCFVPTVFFFFAPIPSEGNGTRRYRKSAGSPKPYGRYALRAERLGFPFFRRPEYDCKAVRVVASFLRSLLVTVVVDANPIVGRHVTSDRYDCNVRFWNALPLFLPLGPTPVRRYNTL